jgi:CRP/FNR family transcriptional regulator, dissimilatory nitrate respiration regulator
MPLNVVEILQNCSLFAEVNARGFQRLATIARLCNFRKGQIIFRENEACPGVYIVGQGTVRVFKTGAGGKEHVLHLVGPGETFAEVAAIGNFDLPASAEAMEKTTCVLLPQERFRQTLAEDHELCFGVMTSLTIWVRRMVMMVEDITLRDAAGRLARFLLDTQKTANAKSRDGKDEGRKNNRDKADGDKSNGDKKNGDKENGNIVKLPGLKRHVASHLNLTSETFSRTLRRLVAAGLILEIDNEQVQLLHPKKLRQVAEGMFPKL